MLTEPEASSGPSLASLAVADMAHVLDRLNDGLAAKGLSEVPKDKWNELSKEITVLEDSCKRLQSQITFLTERQNNARPAV
jgi:uncharacterized protein Yka (UPF0111/DUF47 family)